MNDVVNVFFFFFFSSYQLCYQVRCIVSTGHNTAYNARRNSIARTCTTWLVTAQHDTNQMTGATPLRVDAATARCSVCRSRETVATSLMEWEAAAVRVHLPEQGDSGHITRGVGGCRCPGSSAGAGRQRPHHSWSGRLQLSGFICRSRETVATSLVEWEAASVRVHLPEQGDSGHITRGVGGCICPGSSAGAGRQWPHHSWSGRLHLSGFICRSRETVATSLVEWEAASVRVHLPEQGDSGHITRGVGGCICPGSSAGAGRQWPHHSWSGRLHLSGFICRSRETVATSLVEWEAASVRVHLPEQGDSGHITHGVGGCICPCVCRSRETVATSLMEWEAASVHASAGARRQWPLHSWSGRLHLSMRLPEQ